MLFFVFFWFFYENPFTTITTKIITGDGADEIFAGYNFLVKKDHDELQKELKRAPNIK